jgi:hypothetical protein
MSSSDQPRPTALSVDAVLITQKLSTRPSRALGELAEALATTRGGVLHKLDDLSSA